MASIRLFSGLALKDVFEDELIPQFIAETGATVERTYEPTAVLQELIDAGQRPDVVVGVTDAVRSLAQDGHVADGSVTELVRSEVGVAVAVDAPVPPLDTVDDVERLLHEATSVAYSRAGASGGVFQRVLSDLGLVDVVAPKAVVLEKGFTAEAVRDGRAQVAVQQISELSSVPGVTVVGPLPSSLKAHVELSAAVGAQAAEPVLAGRLVESLTADNTAVFERYHLAQVR